MWSCRHTGTVFACGDRLIVRACTRPTHRQVDCSMPDIGAPGLLASAIWTQWSLRSTAWR
jgi:hypothetical protein